MQRVFFADNLVSGGQMDMKKETSYNENRQFFRQNKNFLDVPCLPWMKLMPVRKNTAGHLWKVSVWKPITDFPQKPIQVVRTAA